MFDLNSYFLSTISSQQPLWIELCIRSIRCSSSLWQGTTTSFRHGIKIGRRIFCSSHSIGRNEKWMVRLHWVLLLLRLRKLEVRTHITNLELILSIAPLCARKSRLRSTQHLLPPHIMMSGSHLSAVTTQWRQHLNSLLYTLN